MMSSVECEIEMYSFRLGSKDLYLVPIRLELYISGREREREYDDCKRYIGLVSFPLFIIKQILCIRSLVVKRSVGKRV